MYKMASKEQNKINYQVTKKIYDLKQEKITKAKEGHYYNKVGQKKSGSQLFLTGTAKKWPKTGTEIVYAPLIRVAGTIEDIKDVMESNDFPQEDVDAVLNSLYTVENYSVPESQGGVKERFDDEFEECLKYKKTVNQNKPKKVKTVLSRTEVDRLLDKASEYKLAEKDKVPKGTGNPSNKKGGFQPKPIKDRLKDLKPGKLLDVSKMNANGSNVKPADPPNVTARTKRIHVQGTPLLSSSEENFVQALKLLEYSASDIEKFRKQYNDLSKQSKVVLDKSEIKKEIKPLSLAKSVTTAPVTNTPSLGFRFDPNPKRRLGSPKGK